MAKNKEWVQYLEPPNKFSKGKIKVYQGRNRIGGNRRIAGDVDISHIS